jgi:hypothetical protein
MDGVLPPRPHTRQGISCIARCAGWKRAGSVYFQGPPGFPAGVPSPVRECLFSGVAGVPSRGSQPLTVLFSVRQWPDDEGKGMGETTQNLMVRHPQDTLGKLLLPAKKRKKNPLCSKCTRLDLCVVSLCRVGVHGART